MTHSVDVARGSYQHLATTEQAVSVIPHSEKEPPTKKRRFFTESENRLISDYFQPSKDMKPPNSDRAGAFLREHQKGGNFSGRSLQQIQDKVKTLIRQMRK